MKSRIAVLSFTMAGFFLAALFFPIQLVNAQQLPLDSNRVDATPTADLSDSGVIFRDDFTGELQPGWTWENEDKEKWSITGDGFLEIIGGHDSLIGHKQQLNLLWHDLPEEDFVVSVHVIADPKENFQQAAIYIYEDPQNFVTINRGYCGPCGGSGFYMDHRIGGAGGTYRVSSTKTDVYLRLESKNKTISGYYATQPDKWVRLGRVGNYFAFKKVGLGVTNSGDTKNKIHGKFDWFEISSAK